MIRYVHIGDQINEGADEFAFYDTVTMKFMTFRGQQVFESRRELVRLIRHSSTLRAIGKRILPLVPEPKTKPTVQQLREQLKSWVRGWEGRYGHLHNRSISDFITDSSDEFITDAFARLRE